MDMSQFYAILWSAVGIIVTGLASWLTAVGVNFLNKKIKDRELSRLSSEVFNIIMSAVQTVFQTFVDTMKKAGTFDEAAAKEAKLKAYKIATSQFNEEIRKYIEDNFGDIEAYVMNQIEAMIYNLKK